MVFTVTVLCARSPCAFEDQGEDPRRKGERRCFETPDEPADVGGHSYFPPPAATSPPSPLFLVFLSFSSSALRSSHLEFFAGELRPGGGGGGGLVAESWPTLCDPLDCSPPGSSLCPWDFPGKNTEVNCHFFLLGIFPTQGLNLSLLHCRRILDQLSHQRSSNKTWEALVSCCKLNFIDCYRHSGIFRGEKIQVYSPIKLYVCVCVGDGLVLKSCPALCDLMDCSPAGASVHGVSQVHENWSGLSFPSPGDLPNRGLELRSPASQVDSLPTEPPGKHK